MFSSLASIVRTRFHPIVWCFAAFAAITTSFVVMEWLQLFYDATGYPVTFMEGQTTFNADTTKAHYAVLIERGTLDDFVGVQLRDFVLITVFIVAMFLAGAASYRVVRSVYQARWIRAIWFAMIWVLPLGGLADAFENSVSFIMLSDPTSFPDWLIYPYSGAAVFKFVMISIGYVWLPLSLMLSLLGFAGKRLVKVSSSNAIIPRSY